MFYLSYVFIYFVQCIRLNLIQLTPHLVEPKVLQGANPSAWRAAGHVFDTHARMDNKKKNFFKAIIVVFVTFLVLYKQFSWLANNSFVRVVVTQCTG